MTDREHGETPDGEQPTEEELGEGRVLSMHVGRSANCSSIGSVVDFLFMSGVTGAAVLSALAVMLGRGESEDGPERDGARPESEADDADDDAD